MHLLLRFTHSLLVTQARDVECGLQWRRQDAEVASKVEASDGGQKSPAGSRGGTNRCGEAPEAEKHDIHFAIYPLYSSYITI